jgi:phosphate starvation-inducible PhoH-like protein
MARKKREPPSRSRKKTLKAKTDNQAKYIQLMSDADITFCSGPAGSGKTTVAVGLACQYLLEKRVSRIIITRPVVESGRGLGHLPGTLIEKINPYLVPVLEEMNMYLLQKNVDIYRENGTIELCPLEYMRGRNFHDCFMILDEAQNATFEQIKMFITRIGRNSKAVINGDLYQSDLGSNQGGLLTCMNSLKDVEGVSISELDYNDIIRSDVVARILQKLNKYVAGPPLRGTIL